MLNSGFVRLGLFISLAPDDWNVAMDMDITVIQWGNYILVLYFLGTFISFDGTFYLYSTTS